jgi:hypothetical protein
VVPVGHRQRSVTVWSQPFCFAQPCHFYLTSYQFLTAGMEP